MEELTLEQVKGLRGVALETWDRHMRMCNDCTIEDDCPVMQHIDATIQKWDRMIIRLEQERTWKRIQRHMAEEEW